MLASRHLPASQQKFADDLFSVRERNAGMFEVIINELNRLSSSTKLLIEVSELYLSVVGHFNKCKLSTTKFNYVSKSA